MPLVTSLAATYACVRARTRALAKPLSAEDCGAQSMPDASPVKWHLAHTTWFFETFVLEAHERGFRPCDPTYRVLFNSYYQGVGQCPPRAQRGLLTRPSLAQVLAYRDAVDARMQAWLGQGTAPPAALALVELGLHHEQQHQELILTDIKHLLWCHPAGPAYGPCAPPAPGTTPAHGWCPVAGGLVSVGHDGSGFAFDNELPHHQVFLAPYALATHPVNNAQWMEFLDDGGYRQPGLWLAEGWDWREALGWQHPMYWRAAPRGGWEEFTLAGWQPVEPAQPVVHLSYYEADAFARWAGARLPTEAEWEHAARQRPQAEAAHWADAGVLHPRPAAPSTPAGTLVQMLGDVWEWTQSAYAPYPGYRTAPGAVGEYNGKFMVNQYVLRGGSCASPAGHVRRTYRNFFPASARWQFAGLRLARDGA